MMIKTLRDSIIVLVFALIIGTPLFYFPQGVFPYIVAKQAYFQTLVEMAVALWFILIYSAPEYRPRWTPLAAAGAIFLALMTLAAFAGVDWWRSLWSTYERGIGVTAFFHLAALGLILSSLSRDIPWKKLFYASLGISLFITFIAMIQLKVPDLLLSQDAASRPGATFGNPSFLAGYLLFNIFLGVYLFFDLLGRSEKRAGTTYSLLVFIIVAVFADIAGIFIGQTRGDILALVAGFLVLFAIFAFRPPKISLPLLGNHKLYAAILLVLLLSGGVFAATRDAPFWAHVPGLERFRDLSFSSFSPANSDVGARYFALQAAWQGFLGRPVLGWGPENFTTVSNLYYDPRQLEYGYAETRFDKPHNFLMEYLIAGGIPLLIALLVFFGAAVYEAFRGKDRLWGAIFSASLVAYIAGNFFLFETLGPLLMLFMFYGFTDGAFRASAHPRDEHAKAKKNAPVAVPGPALALSAAAALIAVYVVNIQAVSASYSQFKGYQELSAGQFAAGVSDFNAAMSAWNPYQWNFTRDAAVQIIGQYFNYPGSVSDEDALKSLHAMEVVRDEHPNDAYDHYSMINLYNEVAHLDPAKYAAAAEGEAQAALAESPHRQEIYFLLAKTKTIENDLPGALAVLKKALDEDPKVPDAHFYYGLVAFATGDNETGYSEIEAAIAMGRQWKSFNEPLSVANFFADSGHLDEAISLYGKALAMNPDDPEAELKLGMAYYYQKDAQNARKYLSLAARGADLTRLPSYPSIKPILDALGIPAPSH